MLKFIVKALGVFACLALSGVACAVGMGGINVSTALGEPLKAEIELVAIGKAEKGSLSARLASPEIFKSAGMDYPSSLSALKFQVETRANGEPYIRMTSAQPVNEPFVSLLVELSWSSGKLLREYTFLLDPPGYKAEQPKAVEIKPVVPSVPVAPSVAATPGAAVAPGVAPPPVRPAAPKVEKAHAVAATPVPDKKPAGGSNVASGAITVKRGDTLSEIAFHAKSSDVSLERMLVALYRANTDAFDGNNMNRLKTGKILQMPESKDLDKLTQPDAIKEIRVQVADWHAYRQKLASASVAAAEHAPKQEASGKISATVADKAPAARESAKEVVRLSKGEAPGDKAAAGGNTKALQDKIHALEEEATAKSKVLKESNERIALLEKNIKDMQRLIELKGQPVAPAKPATGKAEAPAETKPAPKPEPAKVETKPLTPASAVAPASATTPAKPAAKPVAAPKAAPPPPSLLDEPLYLAGGAAALLALGGIGFMLARRGRGGKAKEKISGGGEVKDVDSTARIFAPVAPSPETGDFTQSASAATISPAQAEDVDPINEADLFMSFGRDVQAEEILKDALEKNPASNSIRLKLLSIYANRKDTNAFSVVARQVQDSGDAAAWAQTAEMGRNLEPNNPMYGGEGGEPVAVAEDQSRNEQQQAAGLDFDLGFDGQVASTENESTAEPNALSGGKTTASQEVDFDLGFDAPEAGAATENESAVAPSRLDLDFDLGESGTPGENAAEGEANARDLDERTMAAQPAGLHDAQETAMDFDISATLPVAQEPEQAAAIAPDLNDLVFDITAPAPVTAAITEKKPAAGGSENNDDALEFTLDFPAPAEPTPAPAAAKGAVDLDLSDISLDMGEPASPAPAQATDTRDARWHDVATKLDLAKAYQEMGDNAGAREILEEVLAEGDDQQRATAERALQQLIA